MRDCSPLADLEIRVGFLILKSMINVPAIIFVLGYNEGKNIEKGQGDMATRLEKSKIEEIVNAGVEEFSEFGFEKGNIRHIAEVCDISTGVLYKYFDDKAALYSRCLDVSLDALQNLFAEIVEEGSSTIKDFGSSVVRRLIKFAKENSSVLRLYLRVISDGNPDDAMIYEKDSSELYIKQLESAKERGLLSPDADPKYYAFFFDNLLMMLHFSYSNPYLKKRFEIYCGPDATEDDEKCIEQLTLFIDTALNPDKTI